jgi:hypothetical protein
VRAPFSSSSALVTTVVACARSETSEGATPCLRVAVARASRTPRAKSRGVLGTLTTSRLPVVSSATTTSVNVPPMSTPMRHVIVMVL